MVCDVGFCAVPITTSKQLVAATDPNNDALDAISGAERFGHDGVPSNG